jgi:phospholipid/cholesterol/gamma-HCH transport system substrate-binding protein
MHRLELKSYVHDAQGLRTGAPVRVAGVEVGSVTKVRVRTDMSQSPAEVDMVLLTPDKLDIPSDASVSLATAGVLGETYVDIDLRGSSGPFAVNGAVLKSNPTETLNSKEVLNRLEKLAQRKCGTQEDCSVTGITPQSKDTGKGNTSH